MSALIVRNELPDPSLCGHSRRPAPTPYSAGPCYNALGLMRIRRVFCLEGWHLNAVCKSLGPQLLVQGCLCIVHGPVRCPSLDLSLHWCCRGDYG